MAVSEGSPDKDRAKLVVATANRLRLVQADFADEPEDVRRGYLADEIQRALSGLVPGERQAFLDELKEHFPTWDGNVQLPASAAPAQAPMDQRELKDPSFLVSRLIELAGGLNADQKRALADRLAEAGLARSETVMRWPATPEQMLMSKMHSLPEEPLDPGRVLELLAMLVEFTASLDQLVWTTWRTVAPRSTIKRPSGLLRNFAKFAAADKDTVRGQITQDLDRLRQLTAALVSAISQAGRQFAHSHSIKFSPTEIESLASMEKGGMLTSKEVKCWRKYVELASGRDEAAIEAEIMQSIADYAESLMKGLAR